MGQRFQLFLKVNNPVKNKRNYSSDEDKKLMRKMDHIFQIIKKKF